MSFLGLTGKRLRICDAAKPDEDGEPTFTRVDVNGNVKAYGIFKNYPKPEEGLPDACGELFVPGRSLESPFEGMWSAGGLGSDQRLGGAPAWVQDAQDPLSPKSGEPMTFIGQCEHPLGGTAYCFLDFKHLIAAVVTQNT